MPREQVALDAVRARLLRAVTRHPGAETQTKPIRVNDIISAEYLQVMVLHETNARSGETTTCLRLIVILHSSAGGTRQVEFVDCPVDYDASFLKQGRFYSFPVVAILYENPTGHRVGLTGHPTPSGVPYCQPTWLTQYSR